jgi:hypothetical protein
MPLHKLDLEIYDDYESPIDDNEYLHNYKFFINGYSKQIQKGYFVSERGEGNNFKEAIDNAYSKIYNKLLIKYHIISDI